MEQEEYRKLDEIDSSHWFYRGKRAIVKFWIDKYLPLGTDDLLVDAGMGTGIWLLEMGLTCRVLGLDYCEESLKIAGPRLEQVKGSFLQTSLERVDLPDGIASVVTILDVLEHLEHDRTALEEMVRLTKPGGLIVITVPAMKWLWSDWDVALHHKRRYNKRELLQLLSHPELEVLRCCYFNSLTLLPITLVRFWRRVFKPAPGVKRAEDSVPPRLINELLFKALVSGGCSEWLSPPMGVSLLAVVRIRTTRPQPASRSNPLAERKDSPGNLPTHTNKAQ